MTLDHIIVDKVQSTSRQKTLTQWITTQLLPQIAKDITLIPIKSDASARRYYRVFHAATQCHSDQLLNLSKIHSSKNTYQTPKKLLVVDSPPASENSRFFVHIAKWWQSANITVPNILAIFGLSNNVDNNIPNEPILNVYKYVQKNIPH